MMYQRGGVDVPKTELRLGACGLDCESCNLYRLPTDTAIQDKMVPWFREMGWLGKDEGWDVAFRKGMYCKGCGSPDLCWSSNCQLAKCCKHDKGYHNCSQCAHFVCKKYDERQRDDERYNEGIRYLQSLANRSI
jgi:hypothetical protein